MTRRHERLPRRAEELEALATYYDTHDTSAEVDNGQWVDPRPMKTTSLRLPSDVVDSLKAMAGSRGMRYTALLREIIERAVSGARLGEREELIQINARLARIEAAVTARPPEPRRSTTRSTTKAAGA